MPMAELANHLMRQGVLRSPGIAEAIRKIDRKDFVVPEYEDQAYENIALPIGWGSTISQPLTVAFMLELLSPKPGEKILDIGSGSGWVTAMLAEIAGENGRVFAVEIVSELIERAKTVIQEKYPELFSRISFFAKDAFRGLPEYAPFDGIIAAAALPDEIPGAWKTEIAIGGRIVTPVRNAIHKVVREGENVYKEEMHPGFLFVPFRHE